MPENVKKTSYVIPDSVKLSDGTIAVVTEIAPSSFSKCRNLKKVTVGKNIGNIGKNAFKGCKNLNRIIIKSAKLTKRSFGKNAYKGVNKKITFKIKSKSI
jgi:hypothetical protein